MNMRHTIHAVIARGDQFFVAECPEVPVVTQGSTVDETVASLSEVVALHLEDEDLGVIGLVPDPTMSVTLEFESQLSTSRCID